MATVKEEKKVTKAKQTKVTKPKKEIEIIDSIIDEEVIEEKVEEVKVKKTYKELRNELRKKKDEIEVEILNLNSGGVSCYDRNGRIIFKLDNYGDREFIVLSDIYDVASRDKGFFEKHLIAIIDVDTDEYSIEEIIEYLNLNEIYNGIEDYDTDYIMQILSLNIDKFKKFIEGASDDLVRVVASRAIVLFKANKFDSRAKEQALSKRLGKDDLFAM